MGQWRLRRCPSLHLMHSALCPHGTSTVCLGAAGGGEGEGGQGTRFGGAVIHTAALLQLAKHPLEIQPDSP